MADMPEFVELPKTYLFSPAEAAARELWARRLIGQMVGASRALGYGLFHGGSLIRDIDLVAVPWRQGGKQFSHYEFVVELIHSFNFQLGNHGETIFGHRWYALWDRNHPDQQIDLKIMLPAEKVVDDE